MDVYFKSAVTLILNVSDNSYVSPGWNLRVSFYIKHEQRISIY